jgi:maltose alpha-D-glucosyltransferase/alpha-amylase
MKKNVGIRRRLAPLLGNDHRKIKLMNSLLMSLPGTPIIYYGDEIGMGDNINLYDRNGVRTPMQWNAGKNADFSHVDKIYAPVIADDTFGYQTVNVATQEQDLQSLLSFMRTLIKTRKQHPALGRGHFAILEPENHAILPFVNVSDDDVVVSIHNLADTPQTATLDLSDYAGKTLYDCFSLEEKGTASSTTDVTLAPYQFLWYSLK